MANLDIIKNAVAEGTKDLMRSKTIDSISVYEICEKTGLNRRNFYRYFRDKYEVVEWIYYHDYLLNTEHFEGWSIWDYMPHIAQILYSDRAYYINAFLYTGQNSFRACVIRYLKGIFRPDYRPCFSSDAMYDFYVTHECNMAFDLFLQWLSADHPESPEEFVESFRDWYYQTSRVSCGLLERAPKKRENFLPYSPVEPTRKKHSRENSKTGSREQ